MSARRNQSVQTHINLNCYHLCLLNIKEMESASVKNPKDDMITNKDDSITNKDGDNYLEKGEQPTEQNKPDKELVPTVTPDNENGDPGPPTKESKDTKDPDKEKERLRHIM
jgi:hypothetical protein